MEEKVNFGGTLHNFGGTLYVFVSKYCYFLPYFRNILQEIISKKCDVIKEKRLTHFCINLYFLSW